MTELPIKVYILKRIIMFERPEEPCSENRHKPEYLQIVSESKTFADWLEKSVAIFGAAFRGPLISSNDGFEAQYLLCLHSPWPEMDGISFLQAKLAEGEIFVADDHVYYAQPDALIRFDGQVLRAWYNDEHGADISDLDGELRRRLCRSCRIELGSMGYNGMTIRELTPRWIAAVYTKQPAEWDWSWFGATLKQVVGGFEAETKKEGEGWFVYEALEHDGGPELFPPVENGELILEVHEALVDELGGARQWLVKAQPAFGHSQVRFPDHESIRSVEDCEIFSSRRGVFWNGGSDGTWLGEIGGELFHNHHGEAFEDIEVRIRHYIIESLASGIEARSGCEDFSRIINAIDQELGLIDIYGLWFHDLDPLTERVIEDLKPFI